MPHAMRGGFTPARRTNNNPVHEEERPMAEKTTALDIELDQELYEKLEYALELTRVCLNPDADIEDVLDVALDMLICELEDEEDDREAEAFEREEERRRRARELPS